VLLVIVDDGTGYPSTDLLSSVANAVDAVRPVGTTFAVVPPQVLTVNVSLAAEFGSAGDTTIGVPAIQNYIATYLNSLPIGRMASITRVAQHAYRAGSGLQNIRGVQLNGGSADVVPPALTVIKAGQVVVSTQ
jgi:Baseplate J-like protein